MKRKLILVLLMSIFLVTGCEEKKIELTKNLSSTIDIDDKDAKLVCTTDYDYTELDYVIGSKYVVFADNDGNVTKVVSREIIESNDQEKLDQFEEYLNENHTAASEYNGYEPKVVRTANRVTSDVTIDYEQFDMEKFVEDNVEVGKDIKVMTIDKIEKQYVSLGATCEKK